MRVMFITHYSDLYGANRSMLGLAEDLISRYGVEVYIICPKKGILIQEAEKIGAHVKCFFYVPWRTMRFGFTKRILRKILNPYLMIRIIKYTREVSPDVIHSNTSVCDLGVMISGRINIPCVWHLRELGENDYCLKYLIPSSKICDLYAKASQIISVSDYVKHQYSLRFSDLRITTVYNGIKPFYVEHQLHTICNFCIIGKIITQKGHEDLLKAVKELIGKHIDGFHLYVIGDGEKGYLKLLNKYISVNGLEDYITFTGYMDDAKRLLPIMDVGVMASKSEAFGRVTVEYMLAEMFVIATSEGGTRELIGNRGLYYEYGDFRGLAQNMEWCILNQHSLREKGRALRSAALEKFQQSTCTNKIYGIYEQIVTDFNNTLA